MRIDHSAIEELTRHAMCPQNKVPNIWQSFSMRCPGPAFSCNSQNYGHPVILNSIYWTMWTYCGTHVLIGSLLAFICNFSILCTVTVWRWFLIIYHYWMPIQFRNAFCLHITWLAFPDKLFVDRFSLEVTSSSNWESLSTSWVFVFAATFDTIQWIINLQTKIYSS